MNTHTNKLIKRLPAVGDFDWDDEWWDNEKIEDFIAGGLCSQNRLITGGAVGVGTGLNAAVATVVVIVAGLRYEIAAQALACTTSSLNYIYINSSGVVVAATSPPTGEYVPLAVADTDVGSVLRVGDCRPLAQVVVASRGNVFINGDMAVDQENAGAAVSVSTLSKYFLDMQVCTATNHTAVVNAQQVAGFGGFSKAAKLTVTTAATLTSGKYGHGLTRFIEFKDCQLIAGRYLAFSFKFQAKLAGTYSVALLSGDVSNSYVTTFTYSVAEAVQVVPMLIPVPSAKVIEGANSRGLILHVGIAAVGTYATTTLNQWQSGNYLAASGATDWEVTSGNYIAMTGLYGGPDLIPAEFPFRNQGEELALCKRYYSKSYNIDVKPGTADSLTGLLEEVNTRNNANVSVGLRWQVSMARNPTVTLYALDGTAGYVYNGTNKAASAYNPGQEGCMRITITGGVDSAQVVFHYTADARM